ncbi:MAG: hypothetical protein BWK78_00245 [Thiotrichaceae bacterium IS1]|nr:MAG: hypothetical protein BWK78_00245 [Thiotrichaceae bacterium IS1]
MIKQHKNFILVAQLFCIMAFMPLLLGQSECQVNQSLLSTLENLLKTKFGQSGGQQRPIYVTQLSFADVKTGEIMAQTEAVELVNKAVLDGIRQAERINPNIKFNVTAHEIKNTAENVSKLIQSFYNKNNTPDENMSAIINDMMEPAQVDVIVTGQYLEEQDQVKLKPLVISKRDRKQVAEQLFFGKDEYMCQDPNNSSKKALCQNAYEKIAQTVKRLLDNL